MPLHFSSTIVLNIRRSKLYFTASGIVTPVGGRPVIRCATCAPDGHQQSVTIPEAVKYNFDLLMISPCSKNVEEYNKLIIKQEFVH